MIFLRSILAWWACPRIWGCNLSPHRTLEVISLKFCWSKTLWPNGHYCGTTPYSRNCNNLWMKPNLLKIVRVQGCNSCIFKSPLRFNDHLSKDWLAIKVDSNYCDMPNLASSFFYASWWQWVQRILSLCNNIGHKTSDFWGFSCSTRELNNYH